MKKRPVFLNLHQIRLPFPALLSILHRISGVVMIFGFPILLWQLTLLRWPDALSAGMSQMLWHYGVMKLFVFGMVVLYLYHALAGLKHMAGDFLHYGHTIESARRAGVVVLVTWLILVALMGWRFWGWV